MTTQQPGYIDGGLEVYLGEVFPPPSPPPTNFTLGSGRHSLNPSDRSAPSWAPSLEEQTWAHDISGWDGKPPLPPWDCPWHGAHPTSVLWPVSESLSWIRPSRDLGGGKTELWLQQERCATGSKLRRKGGVHGFNFSLPGMGVLDGSGLGFSPVWAPAIASGDKWDKALQTNTHFFFHWLLVLLRQLSSTVCDFWLLPDG